MNRRKLLTATFGTILSGINTPAHSTTDGPSGRFEDDLISNLEGDWRVSRQIRGTTIENTAQGAWVLNHQFLQLKMKDVATPTKYEAIVLIGYVYSDKQYVTHWIDSFGGKFSGVARGIRTANSVEFRFDYSTGPFFNTFTWFPEKRIWVSKMESQNAVGLRVPFATDTYSQQS